MALISKKEKLLQLYKLTKWVDTKFTKQVLKKKSKYSISRLSLSTFILQRYFILTQRSGSSISWVFNYLSVGGTPFSLRVELGCENRLCGVHNALENRQSWCKDTEPKLTVCCTLFDGKCILSAESFAKYAGCFPHLHVNILQKTLSALRAVSQNVALTKTNLIGAVVRVDEKWPPAWR